MPPFLRLVRAIDHQAADAGCAHLAEGNLLAGGYGHAPLNRGTGEQAIVLSPLDTAPPGISGAEAGAVAGQWSS